MQNGASFVEPLSPGTVNAMGSERAIQLSAMAYEFCAALFLFRLFAEGSLPSQFQESFAIQSAEQANQRRDKPGPAGLMACSDSRAVVPMKVFIEENTIAPVRVFLKFRRSSINRSLSRFIAQEYAREPRSDFGRHVKQVHIKKD